MKNARHAIGWLLCSGALTLAPVAAYGFLVLRPGTTPYNFGGDYPASVTARLGVAPVAPDRRGIDRGAAEASARSPEVEIDAGLPIARGELVLVGPDGASSPLPLPFMPSSAVIADRATASELAGELLGSQLLAGMRHAGPWKHSPDSWTHDGFSDSHSQTSKIHKQTSEFPVHDPPEHTPSTKVEDGLETPAFQVEQRPLGVRSAAFVAAPGQAAQTDTQKPGSGGGGGTNTTPVGPHDDVDPVPHHTEESDQHSEDTTTHKENTDTHSPNTDTHKPNSDVHSENTDTHSPNSDTHNKDSDTHKKNTDTHKENTDTHLENTDTHYKNTDTHYTNTDTHRENTDTHKENTDTHFVNTDEHSSNTDTHYANTDDHTKNTDTHYVNTDDHTSNSDTHLVNTDDHSPPSDTHHVNTDDHNQHSKTHRQSTDNHYTGTDTHHTNSDVHAQNTDTHNGTSNTHSAASDTHYEISDSHLSSSDSHHRNSDMHDVNVSTGHGSGSYSHWTTSGSHNGATHTHNSYTTTHSGTSTEGSSGSGGQGQGGNDPCDGCSGGCSPNTGESEINGQMIQTLVVCKGGQATFNARHRIVTHNTGRPRDLHGTLTFNVVDGDAGVLRLKDGAATIAPGTPIPVTEPGHAGCGAHTWHSGTKVMTVEGLQPGFVQLEAVVDPNPESPEGDGEPSLKARVTIYVVELELLELDFTSGHNILHDEETSWTSEGNMFTDPEWTSTGNDNPFSQTRNTQTMITAKLKVTPQDAPNFTLNLNGDGGHDAFKYEYEGALNGGESYISLVSEGNLPNSVATENRSINWDYEISANGSTASCTLDPTGPHEVFVTLGMPVTATTPNFSSNFPTVKRLGAVCTWADGATSDSEVGDAVAAHFIANDPPSFDLYGLCHGDYWSAMEGTTGYQCVDLAYLMQAACMQVGVVGEVGYCYATTDNANYSILDDDHERRVANVQGQPTAEILPFYSLDFNNWEAVLKIGQTYYAVEFASHGNSLDVVKDFVCPNQVPNGKRQVWSYFSQGVWNEDTVNGPYPAPWPGGC